MKGTSSLTSIGSGHSLRPLVVPPPFDFLPLNRVVSGPGSMSKLGELTRELGGKRVMLVTDPGLAKVGHPQRALQLLQEAGLEVFLFDAVKENPNTHDVAIGVEFARKHQVDFLVAVGGGSSMDCAKGVNFIYTNGGKIADYKGHGKATKPMLPSIGVPTTSGTGSEAQSYALITDASSHMKMACGDKKAAFRVSILDPELTVSQPKSVTAVTGIDAIAHAVESFVCTKRNPISQLYSLAAWQYLEPNFEIVLREPQNLAARGAMQIGAHFAGVAIENAMLGICHSCANPLTAHYGVTHGTAIGILLPHVVRFNAVAVEHLYRELPPVGVTLNGEPVSELVARRIHELVELAGLPTKLREVDVSDSILPLLAFEANEQWTARFNPRTVGETELQTVYENAW